MGVTFPICQTFVEWVKQQPSGECIGTIGVILSSQIIQQYVVGYCFGGKPAIMLAAHLDLVKASFTCHPSMLNEADANAVKIPVGFACAEEDHVFSEAARKRFQDILNAAKIENEFVVYEGTTHGFACRPNLGNAQVAEAYERSVRQTVEFFNKNL